MSFWKKFIERIKFVFMGVIYVVRKPLYLVLTILIAYLFSILIYLLINGSFYIPLFLSNLSILDKTNLLVDMTGQMFIGYFKNLSGALIGIVSLLQGLSLSTTIHNIDKNKQDVKNNNTASQISLSGFTAVAATIGLGCVPCGTSLILPIIMIFFSGSAVAVAANIASIAILLIAIFISIYSIYKVGYIAYIHSECEKMRKES